MGRGAGAGLHHADDRDGQRLLRVRKAGRRGRVAGDDDKLHAPAHQPACDLLHEAVDLREAARAVRAAGRIAHVHDGLVRQHLGDLTRHRQPAEAGVEHADRRVIECFLGIHVLQYSVYARLVWNALQLP